MAGIMWPYGLWRETTKQMKQRLHGEHIGSLRHWTYDKKSKHIGTSESVRQYKKERKKWQAERRRKKREQESITSKEPYASFSRNWVSLLRD